MLSSLSLTGFPISIYLVLKGNTTHPTFSRLIRIMSSQPRYSHLLEVFTEITIGTLRLYRQIDENSPSSRDEAKQSE